MSLILAAALLMSTDPSPPASGPLPNWRTAVTVARSSSPTNTLHLSGDRYIWNGKEVARTYVREFLQIVAEMEPQPMIILSHGARTSPEVLQSTRLLIDGILRCTPATCLEITSSPR